MESSLDLHNDFDLSLEHEYLCSGMYESGMDLPVNYGLGDLLVQQDPPSCSVVNEQTMQDLVSGQYGGEFINPDDFLNDIHQSQADSLDGSSPSNRDTPSPASSQQSLESVPSSGGFESCHVVPMHFESPPISPLGPVSPSQVCQQQPKPCETKTCHTGTTASGRRIKILPKTSVNSNITKTITKKTIVLSAKDYKALIANTLKQPSNNTILLKATTTATNASIVPAKIVTPAAQTKPVKIPAVLPPLALVQNRSAPLVKKTDPVSSVPLAIPMMRASGTSTSDPTIDEKTLKKHQRMIKNRQSAYESRMKKKEYVSSLEDRIQELSNENAQLRQENACLLQRLAIQCSCAASSILISQASGKKMSPTARKNTALVLAMLFMVSLNFYPIGNLLTNTNENIDLEATHAGDPNPYHTRGLLWSNNTVNELSKKKSQINLNLTALDELEKDESTEPSFSSECPFYVNQTENIRLASELRRWIGENGYKNLTDSKDGSGGDMSIDTFAKMFHLKDTIDSMYRQMKDISAQMKTYEKRQQRLTLRGDKRQSNRRATDRGKNEVTPYRGKHLHKPNDLDLYYPRINIKYAEFFEEIGRRDDTFYLVSFSEEHLLLPALAYNKTNRPRMSLMLPTVAGGGPMGNGTDTITLMQIDCEVMNTSVIQIREKAIPGDLRPHANTPKTTRDRSAGAGGFGRNATNTSQTRRPNAHPLPREKLQANHSTDHRKPRIPQQHGQPVRPFFVERMNEHLKSEHHVN
ncbi:cyclic AMP-dependent transcription factor ATF-6 alpha-like [Anopheles albimanus]|uniref:cyclic AMP-dependent transcription factor ATF-6 alpha-like n=1 Tax=Anopheles albimanus TaxID=7167 RepID=UPI001640BF09|nr:cyclic AMP-dependent transcription factor ATF-6 alpha-like [Anopheles albimanus]